MPGVLNCHVHLTDAAQQKPVPGGEGLIRWVGELLASRGLQVDEKESVDVAALDIVNLPVAKDRID